MSGLFRTSRLLSGGGGGVNSGLLRRHFGSEPNFGILFDIDGVIVRGKSVLPHSPPAFQYLIDPKTKKFRVPTVFVTNAGNTLRQKKANQLSDWLNVEITEDQVVMSHSPLKMFQDYQTKHVLVNGQGPVGDIARNLGFQKVTTMKELRHSFPSLDAVDHKRRRAAPCSFERYFPRIEAIVLFGEPIRWETSLQLILDVLLTNGLPCAAPQSITYPHIPILACNMDLQWMAEAVMPRFGHGAYLLCLENLYKKITGFDLIYTGLIGKPSEITYRHSEHVLQAEAKKLGISQPIKNIYCIGDNVCTDIFGANLYNKYLIRRRSEAASEDKVAAVANSRSIDHLIGTQSEFFTGAENCYSVLVETGVYCKDSKDTSSLDHSPRDFLPVQGHYKEPTIAAKNVLHAVDLIFRQEQFS